MIKYIAKEDYFEQIDTEEKAYFLGLLYADGNYYKKGNCISVSLEDKDREILDKFSNEVYINYRPLQFVKAQTVNSKNQYSFRIHNIKIAKDLQNLGIAERKSLTLKFPTEEQIPKHLLNHFIRGYFDGDGGISFGKKQKQVTISFASTPEFLNSLKEILIQNCGVNEVKLIKQNKKVNIASLNYTGRGNANKIKMFLYQNSNIFLNRKKERFERLISDEQSLLQKLDKMSKAVVGFDDIGNQYTYPSIKSAITDLSKTGKSGNISAVLAGKWSKAYNLYWKYADGVMPTKYNKTRTFNISS